MTDLSALQTAARLSELGISIRSPELMQAAARHRAFHENGGNRAMRRQAKRAQRKRGR